MIRVGRLIQTHLIKGHCEEQSDEAIPSIRDCFAIARNDNVAAFNAFVLIIIILTLSAVPVCSAQYFSFISANPVFATTEMPAPTVTPEPEPEISKPKGAHEYHHHGSSEATGSESFDEFFDIEYENQPWRIAIFPSNLFWAGIAMLIFNAGMALALWEMKKKKISKSG